MSDLKSFKDLEPFLEIMADELNIKQVQVALMANADEDIYYHYDTINKKGLGFYRHKEKHVET